MPDPTSRAAYSDIESLLLAVLESTSGIRVPCATRAQAETLRRRFYSFREQDRKRNARLFSLTHARHGTSDYDDVFGEIVEDNALVLRKRTSAPLVFEELSDED